MVIDPQGSQVSRWFTAVPALALFRQYAQYATATIMALKKVTLFYRIICI